MGGAEVMVYSAVRVGVGCLVAVDVERSGGIEEFAGET